MVLLVALFVALVGVPIAAVVWAVVGIPAAIKTFIGITAISSLAGYKVSRKEPQNGS